MLTRSAITHIDNRLEKLSEIGYLDRFPRWTNQDLASVSVAVSDYETLWYLAQELAIALMDEALFFGEDQISEKSRALLDAVRGPLGLEQSFDNADSLSAEWASMGMPFRIIELED